MHTYIHTRRMNGISYPIYIYIHTCIHTYTRSTNDVSYHMGHSDIHTYIHAGYLKCHILWAIQTHTHTYIHTYICIHTYIHAGYLMYHIPWGIPSSLRHVQEQISGTCIHTYTHTCSCIHTYIHTYIHPHTCIRAYVCAWIYIHVYMHVYAHGYLALSSTCRGANFRCVCVCHVRVHV